MTPKRSTPPCEEPLTRGKRKGQPCGVSSVEKSDPPRCRRHMPADSVAHLKKGGMLEAFELIGNVSDACATVGIARSTHYSWLDTDPQYAAAFADAREGAADRLEREATRRARDGVAEPVFYKGEVVGHVQRYSDPLLMFLLKGLRPEKYRERFDVKGKVDHEHEVDWSGAQERLLGSLDAYAERGAVELEQHANSGS